MTEDPPRSRLAPRGELHTPFVVLPERETLFARRANQFEARAEGHELAPYLRFLAGLARVQAALMSDLPALAPIAEEGVARATANGMPPIDRVWLIDDPALMETVASVLEAAASLTMPAAAAQALAGLRVDHHTWRPHLANALEDAVAAEGVAAHIFIASAVQVHAARLAALLPAEMLKPVGIGACPSCGGAPVSSVLVDRPGAHHARYCVCATCATQWNAVRVTCVLCGANAGIAYHHI
jgi:FdhE protein